MQASLEEGSELLDHINSCNKELEAVYVPAASEYVIQRFVEAELDSQTEGERGLGRVSAEVPRFGGYYRQYCARLNAEELQELGRLMADVMWSGYLAHVFFSEPEALEARVSDGNEIYEEWISVAYIFPAETLGGNLPGLLSTVGDGALTQLEDFQRRYGMKGGGFFSKDKGEAIRVRYLIGGFLLRRCEVAMM
jgi:hypothetical protein